MLQVNIFGISVRVPLFLVLVLTTCLVPISDAQTYTLLHNFTGAPDGAMPNAGLIFDPTGTYLYGTTAYGGGADNPGTVFKSTLSGNESIQFSFEGVGEFPYDASYPLGPLAIDTSGNLYVVTYGPIQYAQGYDVSGTIFEISAKGSGSILDVLGGTPSGPAEPMGGLGLDSAGNLYGVVEEGAAPAGSCGDLFEFSTKKPYTYTTLHEFIGVAGGDGCFPNSGPLRDGIGDLFGTTAWGGQSGCPTAADFGCGTVYEYSASNKYSVLYTFNGIDGFSPLATPVLDSDGNLYGTTYAGGVHGLGIVFELSPPAKKGKGWKETILHQFSGGKDGAHPSAGLVLDSKGNIYGTTYQGGLASTTQYGTVFMISNSRPRTKTVLHYFAGAPHEGAYPAGALVFDSQGNLYGTTQAGGSSNLGTLYKLAP
jgi:uncharacterized repeat protein (TIGR03803 family)